MSAPALWKGFRAAQGLVEVVDPPGVCSGDDHEVGIGAGRDRLGNFLQHQLGRDQMVDADVVLDTARQQLVLELDRGEARRFGEGNRPVHVHRIAPAAARVQDNR